LRVPLIAGNWKMNLHLKEAEALAAEIAGAGGVPLTDLVICPPAVYLAAVRQAIGQSSVGLGAQNCWADPNGAFTGEISTSMLVDLGCNYVILGHSERRQLMGETDRSVNGKLHAALKAGLVPIVCVGETLEQREAEQTVEVVRSQMAGSLAELTADQAAKTVIAYEPVWAIGTGRTATPEQAQEVHADLRKWLSERYNPTVSGQIRILYGGSVKADNAAELMGQTDIDGALVGGASLKADSFLAIARAAVRS